MDARWATWTAIATGLTRDATWWTGGSAGSDYLYELCVGTPEAPEVVSSGEPKCPVDDAGPEPVVRDPHNWILNITVTHGLMGLFAFCAFIALPTLRERHRPNAAFFTASTLTYLVAGMTFLISSGYALIPIAAFTAWHYRSRLLDQGTRAFRSGLQVP